VYIKLDQPNTALDVYSKASDRHPGETSLILGVARIYDMLNNMNMAVQFYKKVLSTPPQHNMKNMLPYVAICTHMLPCCHMLPYAPF
jgi:hypothetical protein